MNNIKKTPKNLAVFLIEVYQKTFSPDQGVMKSEEKTHSPTCVFYPSCSEFSKEAIQKYGVLKGSLKSFRRIIRCHPWQKNNIDPVG